jgi:hypothetical protein
MLRKQIGKKRHYKCGLPVDDRLLHCPKKAAARCLRNGIYRNKCAHLALSYT